LRFFAFDDCSRAEERLEMLRPEALLDPPAKPPAPAVLPFELVRASTIVPHTPDRPEPNAPDAKRLITTR
jgi:hypothetical protein